MDENNEGLVTVGRFMSEPEYMVARSRLDSAGIQTFVQNLHIFQFYGGAVGGIELQVRESDAQAALAILDDPGTGNQPD